MMSKKNAVKARKKPLNLTLALDNGMDIIVTFAKQISDPDRKTKLNRYLKERVSTALQKYWFPFYMFFAKYLFYIAFYIYLLCLTSLHLQSYSAAFLAGHVT